MLQAHAVYQRADIVAQVKRSGWAITCKDAFFHMLLSNKTTPLYHVVQCAAPSRRSWRLREVNRLRGSFVRKTCFIKTISKSADCRITKYTVRRHALGGSGVIVLGMVVEQPCG